MFVGAFGSIRKHRLDHKSFHGYYKKERQWLHDSIIEDYLEEEEKAVDDEETKDAGSNALWFILTAGVQGAGKHYTMRSLAEQDKFLLTRYCRVDIDEICRLLPEFSSFLDYTPEMVDSLTCKEAGYIAETLCWASLQHGKSVLWDGSLRHPEWFAEHIGRLKEVFPLLRVAIIHIMAPSFKEIQERRQKKEKSTGRHLLPDDSEYVESEVERIKDGVEIIRNHADFFATICNKPDGLEIVDHKWEDFARTFVQYCYKPPSQHDRILDESAEEKREDRKVSPKLFPGSPSALNSSSAHIRKSRRCSCQRFTVFKSTEDNHCSDDREFYGRFANIRKMLDYGYHKNYTFERQRFQDAVIQHFLQLVSITDKDGYVCTTPTEPWIVFTAGPMGAGKSYTMRRLVQEGRFPLVAFVNVDPDELRRMLPEYHLYARLAPELAGDLTRKEAGFLAELLTLAGLQAGKNVLVDGSLRDSKWYEKYFAQLRKEFPVLRLAIIQVTAPKETILARAKARAEETGRVVPDKLLLEAYEQVPRSVAILQDLVDYHAELHNPADGNIQLVTKGETWESFQAKWVQTCAWVPQKINMKSRLDGATNRIDRSSSEVTATTES
ncbi:hypothetical protein ACA910_001716 [Epithemia clementina (nom. ined.)]